jgi:hypothetical protein
VSKRMLDVVGFDIECEPLRCTATIFARSSVTMASSRRSPLRDH